MDMQSDLLSNTDFLREKNSLQESNDFEAMSECLQVCPHCNTVHYCTLNSGHYGDHRCSDGHTWS